MVGMDSHEPPVKLVVTPACFVVLLGTCFARLLMSG